jgi:hypothetical protein
LTERRAALAATEAELAASRTALAAAEDLQSRFAAENERLQREIARRAGFRWWLLLPWRRLFRALKGEPPRG